MEYIAAGYNMLTDITYADGTKRRNSPGGSWYAVSGLCFWRKNVAYVGTAGPDFDSWYGDWFRKNGIDCRVKSCLPRTLKYALDYGPDGIWTEYCLYGEDYEAMAKEEGRITPEMLADCVDGTTKGIYLEASLSAHIADELEDVKALIPRGVLMWEINGDDLRDPASRQDIEKRIAQVDAFSMNYDEACEFFGTNDPERILSGLQSYGKPCFFRLGERGAGLVDQEDAIFLQGIDVDRGTEPTGCGNCSTAACLIGLAEQYTPEETLLMANLAASYCARQAGPWPKADDAFRGAREQELRRRKKTAQFTRGRLPDEMEKEK